LEAVGGRLLLPVAHAHPASFLTTRVHFVSCDAPVDVLVLQYSIDGAVVPGFGRVRSSDHCRGLPYTAIATS